MEAAVRYYHGMHAPLRNLKVARILLVRGVRNRQLRHLMRALKGVRNGVLGLLFNTQLRKKLRQRSGRAG